MSLFKKMLLIPSVVTVPLVATVLTSCSTINDLDSNLANQLEILTSDSAKEVYKNTWSRDAFAELYLRKNSKDGIVNVEEKKLIKLFLENLKDPVQTTVTTIAGKPITTALREIEGDLLSAFNFYTSWKSSTDPLFFIDQKSAWVEKNLGSLDSTTGEFESIDKFDAKFLYSSSIVNNQVEFKNDFKFLYEIVQTGIQTELLNMMISNFYFTSSTSDIVERGTNYNEIIDGNINGLAYWEATSFDINSPTYFLEKYLTTKSPKIKWNYASDNQNKINEWTNRPIKSIADYTDLWSGFEEGSSTSSDPIFSPDLIVKSSDDTFNKVIQMIFGYNSAIELSGTSIGGDLSTDADDMRRFTYTKSGLLNSTSNINQLVSFDNLKNIEAINKVKESSDPSPFLMPVSIKNISTTTRKKSHQITLEDLEIFNGNNTFDPVSKNSYTEGINTWKVNEIIPILGSTNTQQSIILNMSYSRAGTTLETTITNYLYDVTITWEQNPSPTTANIVTELNESFTFNQNELNTPFGRRNSYIDAIVEGKVSVSYYMRLLPNFVWEVEENSGIKRTKTIDGKEKALGKFSMKGTPWDIEKPENLENSRKLIFTLFMNDSELLADIQKVLVLNDIAILPGDVKEVNDILRELGILYIKEKPDYAKPRPKTI